MELTELLKIALENKSDEQVKSLVAMIEAEEERKRKEEFIEKMLQFHRQVRVVAKNDKAVIEKNGNVIGEYTFANLAGIVEAVVPTLIELGITHHWEPDVENGQIAVTCVLSHKGYERRSTIKAPFDTSGMKNQVQAVGSSNTFLERYSFLAVCGLATKDDDGRTSAPAPSQEPAPESSTLTKEQVAEITKLIKSSKYPDGKLYAKILKISGADSLENIKHHWYGYIIQKLHGSQP